MGRASRAPMWAVELQMFSLNTAIWVLSCSCTVRWCKARPCCRRYLQLRELCPHLPLGTDGSAWNAGTARLGGYDVGTIYSTVDLGARGGVGLVLLRSWRPLDETTGCRDNVLELPQPYEASGRSLTCTVQDPGTQYAVDTWGSGRGRRPGTKRCEVGSKVLFS